MQNHHLNLAALSVLLAGAGVAHAGISTLLLDGYDSDPNGDALGAGSYSSIVFSNPFGQGSDFSLDTALNTGGDVGALVFNSGIGVEQGGTVRYDNGGAGLDFNANALGVNGFDIDFALVDQNFVSEITLYTYDDMGNEVGNAHWAVLVEAGAGINAHWTLADFITSGDFDASNIDQVQVDFNLRNNPTASLDFIATRFTASVPSPGATVLLGIGGLMIGRRKRD